MIEDIDAAWLEYSKNPTPALKDELAKHYAGLAYKISAGFAHKKPNVLDFDDILQEARLGLLDAIDKFDPERGYQFSTYAQQRIRGAVIDGINVMDWTPRKTKKEIRMILAAVEEHGEKNIIAIAQSTGFSEVEVRTIMGSMAKTYIIPMDYEGITQHSPSIDMEEEEVAQTISQVMDTQLTLVEQEFVKLYFFWGYHGNEIGKMLNLNKKELKDIKNSAYVKLRKGLITSGLSLDSFTKEANE